METGAAFGPWLLDKQLGVGGMGEVWLATHRVLGTQIAVKVLAPELTRDARFRERFISEAKVQARLSHPHIAHIQDFLEENGRFAILMEWIPGGTVADAIDRAGGPLPIEQTLRWAKQALEALDFAHRHGVIHRDVKPANLMLDGAGNIKVTDFGIAIALGAGRMTTTGRSIGTLQYMSPEQIMRPQSVDHRADVYSMGVVLYEMLAGRVPFDADTDYALQRLHIEVPPPSLSNLNPLVLAWLESVVLQCLAKSPDDRFAGCASVAAALNQRPSPTGTPMADRDAERTAHPPTALVELSGGAVERPATEPLYRPSQPRPKSRSKRWIALVASGFAAIALMLTWWWARPKAPNPSGSPAAQIEQGKQVPAQRSSAPVTAEGRDLGGGWTLIDEPPHPSGQVALRNSVVAAVRAKDWAKAGSLIDGLLAKFPTDAEALEWRKLLSEGRESDLIARLNPKGVPDSLVPGNSVPAPGGRQAVPTGPTEKVNPKGTRVQAPDGKLIDFPAGMDDAAIEAAMQKLYPPKQSALDLDEVAKRAGAAYTRQDYATAAPLYQQLADSGQAGAMVWLGTLYANGRGVAQDYAQAAAWYRKAAEKGEPAGMNFLGGLYLSGRGVPQDDAEALAWYRKAADNGYPAGMTNLGAMYADGRAVVQDDAKAVAWYRKAADLGYSAGMYRLGWAYANGRGVERDDAQAVAWYRKAADSGNPAAMNSLGFRYGQGRGVERDDAQAVAWFRKAAEGGNAAAMDNLGEAYAYGRGVERDDAKAVAWFRKAAENGNPGGMGELGAMYAQGRGVERDDAQAVAWYRKAAEKGDALGMALLGKMYEQGRGAARDLDQALAWYRKAAALGNEGAKASLKRLGQ